MIKKYTHKPTEIEAVQFTGDNLDEVIKFIGITGDYLIMKEYNNYIIEQRGGADLLYSNRLIIHIDEYVVKNNGKIKDASNLDDYEEITQPTGDKLTQIADHYGKEKQSQKTVEELAELIQAIVKYNADPCEETRLNFMETLAGVGISMGQLAYLYEFTPQELRDIEEFKIARTLQRIAEESNHVE